MLPMVEYDLTDPKGSDFVDMELMLMLESLPDIKEAAKEYSVALTRLTAIYHLLLTREKQPDLFDGGELDYLDSIKGFYESMKKGDQILNSRGIKTN